MAFSPPVIPIIDGIILVRTASLCCNTLKNAVSFLTYFGGDMAERPRKATRLTVSLEEQDHRILNEIALARDASLSWVIRQAIRQFIESTSKSDEKRKTPHVDGARTKR